jgi:hypothetical protein
VAPVFIRNAVDFRRAVRLGETKETLHLEFKRDIDGYRAGDDASRRKGRKEFCRDVAAFANAWGGCLLIGVEEGAGPVARVAVGLQGVDDYDGRRTWIEGAIGTFLVPKVALTISDLVVEGETIIAVNVPASEKLVVLWDPEDRSIECFRRTNEGKGHRLHPDEMEAHAMNNRRASELMFRRVLRQTNPIVAGLWQVELASGVWMPGSASDPPSYVPSRVTLGDTLVGEHDFGLRIERLKRPVDKVSAPVVRVPYGLLREAWITTDQKVGIFLDVRIVFRGENVTLEPF